MEDKNNRKQKGDKKRENPVGRIGKLLHQIFIVILAGSVIIFLSHIFSAIWGIFMMVIRVLVKYSRPITRVISKLTKYVYYTSGSFFPVAIRTKLRYMCKYAGITRDPREVLGTVFVYSIVVPVLISLLLYEISESLTVIGDVRIIIIVVAVTVFSMMWLMLYAGLIMLVQNRTASVEKVLPDMLTIISQNMIAGMTPYNALWTSARSEFGPLAIEIQKVARDTLAGASLEAALLRTEERIQSDKLARSVKLMVQGMRSGGELPTVLQEIAADMRTEQNLFKRMQAETTAQAMFIAFALLFGAPLLFAASLQFITVFTEIFNQIDVGDMSDQAQSGMISLEGLAISPGFFFMYAILTLVISAFFGALLIGLIRTGNVTGGVPLIPILIFIAAVVFLVLNHGLKSFFGGMLAG